MILSDRKRKKLNFSANSFHNHTFKSFFMLLTNDLLHVRTPVQKRRQLYL